MSKGFEFKELEAAGLSKEGRRGPIDRFHRRLLWPIRSVAGDVIGFGARKLFDDDTMPGKYVNTPETILYKKSQVLFGLDLAKRDIAKGHQAVVVEGYTDVMAMHLAGVKTAVASCGTAFGEEHLAMLRRLLMDDSYFRGEIIYTFDGDAAGQAAAMKAFEGDQKMAGQTFVAVAPDGMDPCDLRLKSGDAAVRDLVARRTPMFEFVVKSILTEHDLETAEGRVEALRRTVPVVAQIKESTLRDSYANLLCGWVGWDDLPSVRRRVRDEARKRRRRVDRHRRPSVVRLSTNLLPMRLRCRSESPGPGPTIPRSRRSELSSRPHCSTLASPAVSSTRCRPRRSPTPPTLSSDRQWLTPVERARDSAAPSGSKSSPRRRRHDGGLGCI